MDISPTHMLNYDKHQPHEMVGQLRGPDATGALWLCVAQGESGRHTTLGFYALDTPESADLALEWCKERRFDRTIQLIERLKNNA